MYLNVLSIIFLMCELLKLYWVYSNIKNVVAYERCIVCDFISASILIFCICLYNTQGLLESINNSHGVIALEKS